MYKNTELAQILENAGILFSRDEPMAEHTTFKIGGPADIFVQVKNRDELAMVLQSCELLQIPMLVLGAGSNLLVSDLGIRGAVISMGAGFEEAHQITDTLLYVPAGIRLTAACKLAQGLSLSGAEFAYGIPGSVGGAVYMNAGAYGGEMSHIVSQVHCMTKSGEVKIYENEQCDFSYRHSRFQGSGEIVLGVVFRLAAGGAGAIQSKMDELMGKRVEKQPLELPSAGSAFKRPEQGAIAAAGLIENCGLKGLSVGGAQVSTKHSGFIVNTGGATTKDVLALADLVCAKVYEQTGIQLEKEVEFVGIKSQME